jgi:hypothetical protein
VGALKKKKNPTENKGQTITVGRVMNLRNKENRMIAVIDEEMQKKFPRLAILSTQTVSASQRNNHLQLIKDSEPKLLYDR